MLNKYFILSLFLFLPLVSAVAITDTLITNTVTDYSVYINQTIIVGTLNVTDEGRIEFHDLDTTVYSGKFQNTNDTFVSVLDFYNLIDAILYYDNGTIAQQSFTGNINMSIDIGNNLTVINNYNVTVPSTPIIGDEINQGGGGSTNQTKVNNSFNEPVLIKIHDLSRSFIYFSNGSIRTFLQGDLNITLADNEYFYILNFNDILKLNENQGTVAYDVSGNSNNGAITGATWNNDGVDITMTNNTDYNIDGGEFELLNLELDQTGTVLDYSYRYYTSFGFHKVIVNLIAGFVALALLAFVFAQVRLMFKDDGILD